MTDYEALAARCEAAGGPSEDINEAIMAALFMRDERHIGAVDADTDEPLADKVWVDPKTNRWVSTHAFLFTGSIDDAMRLMPKDFAWTLATLAAHDTKACRYWVLLGLPDESRASYQAIAATPATALVAACLRAKASSISNGERSDPQS